MSVKPTVFLAIKVKQQGFMLSSLTANYADVQPPGFHGRELRAEVHERFFNDEGPIDVRARIKPLQGQELTATLFGWSSEFENDEATPIDERWHEIASGATQTGEYVELKGSFNPFKKVTP